MATVKNYRVKRNNIKNKGLENKIKNNNKGLNKYNRIMNGIAIWTSFYRANPHKFVEEYLGVNLKMFQVVLLYMMNKMNYFMYLASRGQKML